MTHGKVIIAGAGLGGVTLAAALLQAGIDVEVYEQAPELSEIGAGIQISPNACRVLESIGVLDTVIKYAASPKEYRFRLFDSGEVLQTISLGESYRARHGFPYLTIHRADLHRAIAERVVALKHDALRLNARVASFEAFPTSVVVRLEVGGVAKGQLVVGADGIRSAIRNQILGPGKATFTGDHAWRVVVNAEKLPEQFRPSTVDIWVGPGRHAVLYPLRGGEIVNMVGLVEIDAWEEESWSTARPWSDLKSDYSGWNDEIQAVIDAADRGQCYRWALNIREPVRGWHADRAVLLGDAVHATLPYMAQGAAMALEDAIVLTRSLQTFKALPNALAAYEKARFERTARVVAESTANRTLFHLHSAEELRKSFAGRDISAERNAWVFTYDATRTDIETIGDIANG